MAESVSAGHFTLSGTLHDANITYRISAGHFVVDSSLLVADVYDGHLIESGRFDASADFCPNASCVICVTAGHFELNVGLVEPDTLLGTYVESGHFELNSNISYSRLYDKLKVLSSGSLQLDSNLHAGGYTKKVLVYSGHFSVAFSYHGQEAMQRGFVDTPYVLWGNRDSLIWHSPHTIESVAMFTPASVDASFPVIDGIAYGGGYLSSEFLALGGEIEAHVNTHGSISSELPSLDGRLFVGGSFSLEFPALQGSISVSPDVNARIRNEIPAPEGVLWAMEGKAGSLTVHLKPPRGVFSTSSTVVAEISSQFSSLSCLASGSVLASVSLESTMPCLDGHLEGFRLVDHEVVSVMPPLVGGLNSMTELEEKILRYERVW